MNTLKSIAIKRSFNTVEFSNFALRDSEKYGIIQEEDEYVVSDWFADHLILDFFDYMLERENMKTLIMFKLFRLERSRK